MRSQARPPCEAGRLAVKGHAAEAFALVVLVVACGTPAVAPRPTLPPASADTLRPPSAFDVVPDRAERSRAMFTEVSRVLFHPRCANCHPDGDEPTQRDALERHDPPVRRGEQDQGIPGLMCASCHQDTNATLARVPGAPKWQLAPRTMAWQGHSGHQVCEQIKDGQRNGHRSLEAIADHMAHDPLVGWAWHPGADRSPPPGTQAEVGALVAAWIATGAECPAEDARAGGSR
jgi:hypothetical protein